MSGVPWIANKEDAALAQAVITVNYTFSADFIDGDHSDGNVYNKQWIARADATKGRAQDLEIQWEG